MTQRPHIPLFLFVIVVRPAGTSWDKSATAEAEDALQLRYGFARAADKQQALHQALYKLHSFQMPGANLKFEE